MTMRIFHLLFLTIVFVQASFAHSIKGTVVNNNSKGPLEFVTVTVLRSFDSSLVLGTVTDSHGNFEIKNIPDGNYILRLSFIGYEERKIGTIELKANDQENKFENIILTESTVAMDEVLVTAEKTLMNNAIDRKIYNVDQDVLSKSSSASELLQNIPSVQVDIDGNVSLRGSSNVLILINGKTSPLLEKSQATVLQQLPAVSIEKVELITNPSAKYKSDGASGIINIVLKNNSNLGINGNITLNAGNKNRYNGNISLNYNPGDFNIYGNYGYRKDNRNRFTDINENGFPPTEYYYSQYMNTYIRPISHMFILGIDYKFNAFNSAGISGNYFHNGFTRTDYAYNQTQNSNHIDTSVYNRNRFDPEYEEEYGFTAFFEHKFPEEDHKLRAEFKTSHSPELEDNHYTNINLIPVTTNTYDIMKIANDEVTNEFSIDYSNPLADHTMLEIGYAGELNYFDYNFHAEKSSITPPVFVIDTTKTNEFLYDESIHAFYTTIEHSFGKFGVLGGLRAVQVFTKANQVTEDSIIKNNYFTFYPTLHLSYKISDAYEIQLNYSKRTHRGDPEHDLNPFPQYRDERNVSVGNANLKPEYIHSLEFGFKVQNDWVTLLPSIYYRYTYNRITTVTQNLSNTVFLTRSQNLSNDQAAGVECIISASINDLFSANLSANVNYNEIDASNLGYSNRKSTVTWSGAFTGNLHATSTTMLQVNSIYNAAQLTPQGENAASYVLNLGLHQELIRNSLSLVFIVADIFKSLKRETTVNAADFSSWFFQRRDSQIFYFGVTYTFGAPPKKVKKDESLKYDNGF
jgi:outer membrane receptor protein involved in Fe transport